MFFTEGIQKFLFPEVLAEGRFEKIGIPNPYITPSFVGVVEIVFGALLLLGLLTRLATIPLIIDISTVIATTKIPLLFRIGTQRAALGRRAYTRHEKPTIGPLAAHRSFVRAV